MPCGASDHATHLRRKEWAVGGASLATAQEFVRRLHYAQGGANTATYCHGLYAKAAPLLPRGIAWWLPPTRTAAEASYPGGDWRLVLTLSRLVIEPEVPTNAASFLLSRSVALIRRGGKYRCLVTYADEGQGHTGAIYRAANWTYVGLTAREPRFVDDKGRMVARKAGGVTRTRAQMVALGYREAGSPAKHKFVLMLPGGRDRGVSQTTMTFDVAGAT